MNFNCQCGSVAGEIERPEELVGIRFVCMCQDCQKYAHLLGKPTEIVDKNGGTEVVPVFPKLITFTRGFENIRGVKFTSETGTFRWFAKCCRSPIANSLTSRAGYIGLINQRLNHADRESLGPVSVWANGVSGIAPLPPGTSKKFPLKWFFVTVKLILRMLLKRWKRPNPFFDEKDQPLAHLEILRNEGVP